MKIGIIGAGNIGSALVKRFKAAGHDVSVANSRGPETLRDLAAATGAKAVTVREAARNNDLVVITIPEKRVIDLPQDVFEGVPDSVVVIDTGNYYPQQRDGRIDGIESGLTESRWVSNTIGRRVVKAFNTIYADHLLNNGKRPGTPGRIALPISGDSASDKAIVAKLIDAIGFDVVDDGNLDDSWRQQPGTPVYTKDYDAEGVRRALSQAKQERSPEWRATASSPGTFEAPA